MPFWKMLPPTTESLEQKGEVRVVWLRSMSKTLHDRNLSCV